MEKKERKNKKIAETINMGHDGYILVHIILCDPY
jgi:hypothetical protein